jgi:hypothetical protein
MTTPLKSALTPSQQKQRRLEAQALRSRPRCAEPEHDWRAGDEFSLASGERVTIFQCNLCLSTHFVYGDRTDERETAP